MNRPHLSLIWAMDRRRLIGHNNRLPWRLPADFAYFKQTTMGHSIIMGRKTFESFAKPLPGRTSIILTRDSRYVAPAECIVVHSVEEAIDRAVSLKKSADEQIFVIGGSEIYALFLPLATRLYVTRIDGEFTGDAYFPPYDERAWQLVSKRKGTVDDDNPIPHTFEVYERIAQDERS